MDLRHLEGKANRTWHRGLGTWGGGAVPEILLGSGRSKLFS